MSTTWGQSEPTAVEGAPPTWAPGPTRPTGPPVGPDPRAGRSPWPLAPLTAAVALVLGVLVADVVGNLVLSELPWSETFDLPGTFTYSFVLGVCLVAPLVLLALLTTPRPGIARALLGVLATAALFAFVAVVVSEAVEDFGIDPPLGSRTLLEESPVDALAIPYHVLVSGFSDRDLLQVTALDVPFFLTVPLTLAVLLGLVGFGGTLASGGTVRSAVLAAVGGGAGAAVGELLVQVGFVKQLDWFLTADFRTPTVLVLLPILLGGAGVGLGALVGRPRRAAIGAAPVPQAPPHPGVAAGYVPATGDLAPVGQPLAAPPPTSAPPRSTGPTPEPPAPSPPVVPEHEPPPGATSF